MAIELRPYQESDWPRLCAIHDRARLDELRGSVDLAAFRPLEQTAQPEGLFDGEVWVADDSGSVVGFVAVSDDEISWLYVDPARYRQGIGRKLVRHAVSRCGGAATVEVLAGNIAAIRLYQGEGFAIRETRQGKLTGNEQFAATGHIMVREQQA